MQETQHIKLPIIPENEYTTTKVVDMIKANQGTETTSAFNILDSVIHDIQVQIAGDSSNHTYNDIQSMIAALNSITDKTKARIRVGDSIYLVQNKVPDLWVGVVEDTYKAFTYVSDKDFIDRITADKATTVQVGFYRLFQLETGDKSNIEFVVKPDSGAISLTLEPNRVTTYTSKQLTSITLSIPSPLPTPYYSEFQFNGDQELPTYAFIINSATKIRYIQFNREIPSYNPTTHSSTHAVIDLLFYYDNINLYCFVNEINCLKEE